MNDYDDRLLFPVDTVFPVRPLTFDELADIGIEITDVATSIIMHHACGCEKEILREKAVEKKVNASKVS